MTWKLLCSIFIFSVNAFAAGDPDIQSAEEIAAAHAKVDTDFAHAVVPDESYFLRIAPKYRHLDPHRLVPSDLLRKAVAYFDANSGSFPNQNYISIVDFTPRSDAYRFFLIDLNTGAVEQYHTTHGSGSDVKDYARKFSNVENSEESSLGYIRTAEVYDGTFKRSLRLDGLSVTNSNIRDRAIIFHGMDGVVEANVIQALTWGCIALDWHVKDAVLDKIKEGSLIYVGLSKN